MKDRNSPATIVRCKENGNCQFIVNQKPNSNKVFLSYLILLTL